MNDSYGFQPRFAVSALDYANENGIRSYVLSMQLPYDVALYNGKADAIIAGYGRKAMDNVPDFSQRDPETYGVNYIAAMNVLFGKTSPQGRLPVDIPNVNSNGQMTDGICLNVGYGMTITD